MFRYELFQHSFFIRRYLLLVFSVFILRFNFNLKLVNLFRKLLNQRSLIVHHISINAYLLFKLLLFVFCLILLLLRFLFQFRDNLSQAFKLLLSCFQFSFYFRAIFATLLEFCFQLLLSLFKNIIFLTLRFNFVRSLIYFQFQSCRLLLQFYDFLF